MELTRLDRRTSCRILVLVHRHRVRLCISEPISRLTELFRLELTVWFVPSVIENALAVRTRPRPRPHVG